MKKILLIIGGLYLAGAGWAAFHRYQGQKNSGHTPELKAVILSADVWLWPFTFIFKIQ